MKKTIAVFFLASLSVSGCVSTPAKNWYKDGATQEEFSRDKITCKQYGMQSATANGMTRNAFVGVWINDKAKECMQELGYEEI